MSKTTKTLPTVSRPQEEDELSLDLKLLRRLATNAVREACEVRRGDLTPRAILAYQWLTEAGSSQQTWTLAWICLELDWDYENWRSKALAYVHRKWRGTAWREFMRKLEARSRQVRSLANGGGADYLPLVELSYWHEIADVDLPESEHAEKKRAEKIRALLQTPLEFDAEAEGTHTELV